MTTGESEKREGQGGQVLFVTVIVLVALCAVIALALDAGYLFDDKRRAQTAADAAALAGAEELKRGDTAGVVGAGDQAATTNGFTDGASGTTVTVNNPPTSGRYAGDAAFVEAIVTRSRPNLFMSLVGYQTGAVGARAVAGWANSTNCIYALNPTAQFGLKVSGGGALTAQCGVVVNSNTSMALNCGGGGNVVATSTTVTGGNSGCAGPATPQTSIPPSPDPLADRTDPCTLGYLQGKCTTCSKCCDYNNTHVNGKTTSLGPGVYCGGITVSNGGNATFTAGTYVLEGGGLNVSGQSSLNGTSVTFYNTGTNKTYGPISISGGTVGSLTAPTSGPMEGMLFFQDRTITSNATNMLSGQTTLSYAGVLYFPTTALSFSGGGSATAAYTILVADTITITGQSTINDDFSSLQDGDPIKRVALGE